MKSLNSLVEEHKNQLISADPFIFLFEIETKDSPPRRIRLCQFDKIVNYGISSSGENIPYYPAPISVGSVAQNANGDLPSLEVTVALAGPLNIADIDASDGYVGQPTRVIVISSLDLGAVTPTPLVSEDAEIIATDTSEEAVKFTITGTDLFQSKFPHIVYSRTSCPYRFGGPLCQYNRTANGAALSECGVTISGATVARPFSLDACTIAGDDEEARFGPLGRRHPRFWGGERGIPRG